MRIPLPQLSILPIKISAGDLLNKVVLGTPLQIPSEDIELEFKLILPPTPIQFDENIIIKPILTAIEGIAQKVVDALVASVLNQLAEYYGLPPAPAPEEPAEEEEEPTPIPPTLPFVCDVGDCREEFATVQEFAKHLLDVHQVARKFQLPE